MLTVDANVFVSSLSPSDPVYLVSLTFLNKVRARGSRIVCPSLVLPECVGAIIRPTGNVLLTQTSLRVIQTQPNIRFVPLTSARSLQAAQAAIQCRLRGADAVYAAVAQEFGMTLVTWDQELLTRGIAAVPTMTPADWLAANPI